MSAANRIAAVIFGVLVLTACAGQRDRGLSASDQVDSESSVSHRSEPDLVTAQLQPADFRLQALSFTADGTGLWVSGTEGRYALATSEVGRPLIAAEVPWSQGQILNQDVGEALQFRDVEGASANQAVLLAAGEGPASRIYTTQDGGANWSLRWQGPSAAESGQSPKPVFLDCMDFWDAGRGLVFGDTIDQHLYILSTEDGGQTWNRLESAPQARTSEGGFAASGDCLVTAEGGWAGIVTGAGPQPRLVFTQDYGRSWRWHDLPLPNGEVGGAFALAVNPAAPATSAWFVGGGDLGQMTGKQANVVVSRDQGVTWRELGLLPIEGPVYGLAADYRQGAGAERVVVVGPGGAAISTDGGQHFEQLHDQAHWSVAFHGDQGVMVGPEARVTTFSLSRTQARERRLER